MKIRIHPLFIVFAAILIYFGYGLTLLIYLISLIAHEAAHIAVALRLGYKLGTVNLLPQGAAIFSGTKFLKRSDEIKIALAGPMVSAGLVLFVISLWWLAPETYAATEAFAYSNASIAVFNLLPVLPLDGGRIALASFSAMHKRRLGIKVLNMLGLAAGFTAIGLFAASLFFAPNFSLLTIGVFIVIGVLSDRPENSYATVFDGGDERAAKLARGMHARAIAISKEAYVSALATALKAGVFNVVFVVNQAAEVEATLYEDEILKILTLAPAEAKIKDLL